MKLKTRTAALSVAALTAAVGVPTAAAAAPEAPPAPAAIAGYDEQMFTDDPNSGARVRFTSYGDVVEVCDIQADGYAAYVEVWDQTVGINKYDYRIGGDGRCQTLRASLGGKYNLPEGHVIGFTIALVKGGSTLHWPDTAYWEN